MTRPTQFVLTELRLPLDLVARRSTEHHRSSGEWSSPSSAKTSSAFARTFVKRVEQVSLELLEHFRGRSGARGIDAHAAPHVRGAAVGVRIVDVSVGRYERSRGPYRSFVFLPLTKGFNSVPVFDSNCGR